MQAEFPQRNKLTPHTIDRGHVRHAGRGRDRDPLERGAVGGVGAELPSHRPAGTAPPSSSLLLSRLKLSDTKVYESQIRALLGTVSHVPSLSSFTVHASGVEG